MNFRHRTAFRDRTLMTLLACAVAGLVTLVINGSLSPRLPSAAVAAVATVAPVIAKSAEPPPPAIITQSETRQAARLKAAFDRIGFNLDAVAAGYISVPPVVLTALPADLDRLDDAEDRKSLFLRSLLPIILLVNDRIGHERAHLLVLRQKIKADVQLTGEEVQWMLALADRYDQPDADPESLVQKVDVLPPSLALAQAIEESGWGTSRLARHDNALFGQFGDDGDGGYDYVAYTSLLKAVEGYARNLNTHQAYREFRLARAHMRHSPRGLDARQLVATLHRYSELGDGYVDALREIIVANELEALDGARLNPHAVTAIVASSAR